MVSTSLKGSNVRDYIEIGVGPYDEPCVCVGEEDYYERAKAECQRFIKGLESYFGDPDGCYFKIKWNEHDFGTYADVVIYYDDNYKEEVDYAFMVESNIPATWEELENFSYKG